MNSGISDGLDSNGWRSPLGVHSGLAVTWPSWRGDSLRRGHPLSAVRRCGTLWSTTSPTGARRDGCYRATQQAVDCAPRRRETPIRVCGSYAALRTVPPSGSSYVSPCPGSYVSRDPAGDAIPLRLRHPHLPFPAAARGGPSPILMTVVTKDNVSEPAVAVTRQHPGVGKIRCDG